MIVVLGFGTSPASVTADAPEMTACGIVTGTDAQKFIGGPLDVKQSAKVPAADGTNAYVSACSYLARGENFQDMLSVSRGLDVTLHFMDTPEATTQLYERSYDQYRLRIDSPNFPYANATIIPIDGFGNKAFLFEAVADSKTGYRSALIVFYKGKIAGSVAAWNKPASSAEITKKVLKDILGKLP